MTMAWHVSALVLCYLQRCRMGGLICWVGLGALVLRQLTSFETLLCVCVASDAGSTGASWRLIDALAGCRKESLCM